MKLPILILSGLLASVTVPPAHAADWMPAKKGVTLLGATAAGVALGGPLGMIGGALVAAWVHETMDSAADAELAREELAGAHMELRESESEIAYLEIQLDETRQANLEYAQLVLDQLELEMLFKTNATELTDSGQEKLARLAEFLVANPQIAIRLDGYADPRGGDSFNKQLSLGRVNHVARALAAGGVDAERMESFSHGASQTRAGEGDYDAYALERVVKIKLSQPGKAGYASTD